MARLIIVSLNDTQSSFEFSKIDRSKLYGRKRRLLLDHDKKICRRAKLTEDGSLLLQSGMTGQGYFDDENNLISSSDLVGIKTDGEVVNRYPSTLNIAQPLIGPVNFNEILDLKITTVYELTPKNGLDGHLENNLSNGKFYSFPLNYTADFRVETAYLIKNKEGYFAIVGIPTITEWNEPHITISEVFESTDEDGDEDLDFEMF